MTPAGPRIYNLFPLLAGPMPRWEPHLQRAAAMGFTWIFVNAFQAAGYSGSLYSIRDHYAIDPRLLEAGRESMGQFRGMLNEADSRHAPATERSGVHERRREPWRRIVGS